MTSLPARTFRFTDRGVVREAAAADLLVFDPAHVQDKATFEYEHPPEVFSKAPFQSPIGQPQRSNTAIPIPVSPQAIPKPPFQLGVAAITHVN